jgi:acyl-CoA thioester hydrolase
MPVAELQIFYKQPAYYDELLTIRTTVPEIPRASFLTTYEVLNEKGALSARGKVRLAFIDRERNRPVRAPDFVLAAVQEHWKEAE